MCVESASSSVGVRIVRVRLRNGRDRRLALHGDVRGVVVHLEQRLGGIDDLPDDDRGDLDGVGAAVVHLELGRLEVPDAQRDLPLGEERVGEPEALLAHGALVLAEELQRLGLARVHDEESAKADEDDDEDDDLCFGHWNCFSSAFQRSAVFWCGQASEKA